MLLASSFSPVYPCHVPQNVMRTRPIGTGPFKFVEFKRGDSIRLTRNPDYFKKGRPYLDEITFKIVESQATRLLAFQTGDFDITFPSDVHVPLFKDLKDAHAEGDLRDGHHRHADDAAGQPPESAVRQGRGSRRAVAGDRSQRR